MDPEPEQVSVTFNESYRALWQPLPASQRREAVKRLTGRRKDPLPIESLGDEHPDIEACLTRLSEAYDRKKVRCAKTSAQRRFQRKRKTADAQADAKAETETAETAEPVADTVAAATAPAAEIVAVSEAEPEPTPAPAPAPEPAPEPEPAPKQASADSVKKKAARAKPAPAPVEPPAPVDTPPASVDTPPAQAPQKARSLLSKRGAPRRVDPASSVGRPLIERR